MKPLIILLATAATLPLASPDPNVGRDPPSTTIVTSEHGTAAATNEAKAATVLVVFGGDTVRAEMANTPALRSQGLMNRTAVPDGTGMLFVFNSESIWSFWMQNTYVALDVAFIDAEFRIVDIQQMEPESTDVHDGASPALFALEVRQVWFAEKGIVVGDVCELIY